MIERRHFPRFSVKEEAVAFISGNTPCRIRDISRGGIMLQSVFFDQEPADSIKLDIFLGRDKFYLPNIPIHIVSHSKRRSSNTFSQIQVERLGFRFGDLSEQQQTQLDYFISQNAIEEA